MAGSPQTPRECSSRAAWVTVLLLALPVPARAAALVLDASIQPTLDVRQEALLQTAPGQSRSAPSPLSADEHGPDPVLAVRVRNPGGHDVALPPLALRVSIRRLAPAPATAPAFLFAEPSQLYGGFAITVPAGEARLFQVPLDSVCCLSPFRGEPGRYELSIALHLPPASRQGRSRGPAAVARLPLEIPARGRGGIVRAPSRLVSSMHLAWVEGTELWYQLVPVGQHPPSRHVGTLPWLWLPGRLAAAYRLAEPPSRIQHAPPRMAPALAHWAGSTDAATTERILGSRLLWGAVPRTPVARLDPPPTRIRILLTGSDAPVIAVEAAGRLTYFRAPLYPVGRRAALVRLGASHADRRPSRRSSRIGDLAGIPLASSLSPTGSLAQFVWDEASAALALAVLDPDAQALETFRVSGVYKQRPDRLDIVWAHLAPARAAQPRVVELSSHGTPRLLDLRRGRRQ